MTMQASASLDHLVGAQEDRRWQRHAHGPGGLEIDDELEAVDLLERQIGGLRATQDLRDQRGRATHHRNEIHAERHESAHLDVRSVDVDRGKPILDGERGNLLAIPDEQGARQYEQRLRAILFQCTERGGEVVGRIFEFYRPQPHAGRLRRALGGGELVGGLRIPERGDARAVGKRLDEERELLCREFRLARDDAGHAPNWLKPVVLPPGRARLAASPPPTGSVTVTKTIGTLLLERCNAATMVAPAARITSGASA